MRPVFSDRVERARGLSGHLASSHGDDFGHFRLRTNEGADLLVVISGACTEIPWEHVSVSTKTRVPNWSEMCWVKSLFFEDEETVIQFHPPKSRYVNCHPFCLHLWRPIGVELPLPPTITVGPMGVKHGALGAAEEGAE